MSRHLISTVFIFTLINILHYGDGARILVIAPTASISHQVVLRGLALELNKRGHELVVVTTNPLKDPTLKNYREIDINMNYGLRPQLDWVEARKIEWVELFWLIAPPLVEQQIEAILNHPELKELYKPGSNEKFDLMILEMLYWSALLPLGKRFDVPVIGMTSLGLGLNSQYAIGNPILPSHPSTWESVNKGDEPRTLWKRLTNFVKVWKYLYHYKNSLIPQQQQLAKKYFGEDVPDLSELQRNISLIFVNQQTPISFVRANVPKVIDIGGFHISKKVQSLPEDLKKILDEATSGFVYMSLGSNVKSSKLNNETRREFLTAFSKLRYKVLWKFEDEVLPGKPDNVVIMKWTPQQAVLAHPNLKVFVYQGGLQSTEEAIHHAVPLVGLPCLFDQDMNVNKMISLGVAKKMEITAVRSEQLLEAITTIATDKRYKERMLNLRSLVNDKPQDAMETAIWWTEHVIRHRGAPQLHSSMADEPWYRRYDMDLVAILSAGSMIVLLLTLVIAYKSFVCIVHLFRAKSAVNKEKKRK